MRIQQPIDTSDLLDVGDMLVNKNSRLQQNSVENVIPFLYKMGKKKKVFLHSCRCDCFPRSLEESPRTVPRRSFGDLTMLNMHFGIK